MSSRGVSAGTVRIWLSCLPAKTFIFMAQAATLLIFRDRITINIGASIGCQAISVMSSRSFHGPTPQLILSMTARCEEHRSLKLKSLNKIQKKWCVAQFFLPTNNETEGFKSKLISKLLLLPNKRLMFQLSINIQLFRENKLDLCTSWFEFLLETALCTGRDEMRSLFAAIFWSVENHL